MTQDAVTQSGLPPPLQSEAPADATALLLSWLSEHDAACPMCGYNLRHLSFPRCPECGQEVRFRVALAEPFLAAWVALAVVTCLSGGIGLLFLLMVVAEGRPPDVGHYAWMMTFMAWHWANIPLAVVVLLGRRRFLGMDKGVQKAIAWVAWAVSVVAFVLMSFTLFD